MAATEPPQPDFVIQHLAARGEVSQVWGPPGVGKSMLVEACCGGVGHGEEVAGLRCDQGRVLYLDAENGEYEVHRRVRNLRLPSKQVSIYDAGSAHLVRDRKFIQAVIEYEQPDLLVLDSLRRLTPGTDENDSGDMAEVIGVVKRWAQHFDLAALLIHHARKDGTIERGSSAIKDQVSVSWEMRRVPGSPDRHVRCLHNDKMRVAAEPDDLWLRIVWDQGVQIVAADSPDDTPPLASGPKRDPLAHDIVEKLRGKQGTRPQIARALGRERTDGTLRRALDDLEDAGLVTKRKDGRYSLSPPAPPPDMAGVADGTPPNGASRGASGDDMAPRVATKASGAAL